ncbi:RNK Ribonuclease, partial [Alcedo cyanopectus]|nr:RNK Ribonuclease [Ceyx cyanopectus]
WAWLGPGSDAAAPPVGTADAAAEAPSLLPGPGPPPKHRDPPTKHGDPAHDPAMVSLLCCGPKMAACGMVLSAWGVIMLVSGWGGLGGTGRGTGSGPGQIQSRFEQLSINCFLAAGLYGLLGALALCQARLHKRKEFLVR